MKTTAVSTVEDSPSATKKSTMPTKIRSTARAGVAPSVPAVLPHPQCTFQVLTGNADSATRLLQPLLHQTITAMVFWHSPRPPQLSTTILIKTRNMPHTAAPPAAIAELPQGGAALVAVFSVLAATMHPSVRKRRSRRRYLMKTSRKIRRPVI